MSKMLYRYRTVQYKIRTKPGGLTTAGPTTVGFTAGRLYDPFSKNIYFKIFLFFDFPYIGGFPHFGFRVGPLRYRTVPLLYGTALTFFRTAPLVKASPFSILFTMFFVPQGK